MARRSTSRSNEDPMMDRLTAMILAASTAMEAALEILEERRLRGEPSDAATSTRRRKKRVTRRKSQT